MSVRDEETTKVQCFALIIIISSKPNNFMSNHTHMLVSLQLRAIRKKWQVLFENDKFNVKDAKEIIEVIQEKMHALVFHIHESWILEAFY